MAKQAKKSRNQPAAQPSRVLWFVFGSLSGIFAAAYLAHINALPDIFQWLPHSSKTIHQVSQDKRKAPQFDFYNMLQKNSPSTTKTSPTSAPIVVKSKPEIINKPAE